MHSHVKSIDEMYIYTSCTATTVFVQTEDVHTSGVTLATNTTGGRERKRTSYHSVLYWRGELATLSTNIAYWQGCEWSIPGSRGFC